jgi:hypothetical protein
MIVMEKYILLLVILLSAGSSLRSQNNVGKSDDIGRLSIAAIVPDEAGLPAETQTMLQNKMMQIATQNGLGASAERAQFAMVPVIAIISKDVTPTAPPQIALTLELSFYIVDALSQNIFSQTTVSLKGVGNTEERAYSQALRNLNPRQGQFRGFVDRGKEDIIAYYNSQCDVIITGSQALADQQQYGEALFLLMSVPDVSRECFQNCMALSADIYKRYADQKCEEYLAQAKAAWAAKELDKVAQSLGKITPDMSCYLQGQQLVNLVTSTVEAEGASSWEFKMTKYDDQIDLQKMRIEAGKEIAKSWAYYGAAKYFDWNWLYKN